jgi:small-conductance mechanosensitive channel
MSLMFALLQNTNSAKKIVENASQVTNVAWDSVNDLVTSIIARLPYILAGILVLGLFYLLAQVIRAIFWTASKRTRLDYRLRILFSRLIGFFIVVLGIFTALTVIIPAFTFGDLITGLGFTSFVIGFATKDILNNLLSGVMILWQQPFRIGDQIFVGSNQGKVEYIGVRATSLRKDDGELVLIPNGDMYNTALTIRGAGAARRMAVKLKVDFAEDIERVKQLCHDALAGLDRIKQDPPATARVTDISVDGVTVTVNFWIDTNEARPQEVFDNAAISVLKKVKGAGVKIYNYSPANAPQGGEQSEQLPSKERSSEL